MMSNQITAGSMVLIIHDASDIVVAFGRGYCETKFESKNRTVVTYVMMVLVWVYLRIFVFPYCLLSNVYVNKPSPQD